MLAMSNTKHTRRFRTRNFFCGISYINLTGIAENPKCRSISKNTRENSNINIKILYFHVKNDESHPRNKESFIVEKLNKKKTKNCSHEIRFIRYWFIATRLGNGVI